MGNRLFDLICEECGSPYRGRSDSRFCSLSCWYRWFRKSKEFRNIKKYCISCGKELKLNCNRDLEIRKFCSKKCSNKYPSEKRTAAIRDRKGDKNPHWYKDRSKVVFAPREDNSVWRKSVFSRDNYTCQLCGERGGNLVAHHIIAYSESVDKRWDIENGQTLCFECHKKTDNYGIRQHFKLRSMI